MERCDAYAQRGYHSNAVNRRCCNDARLTDDIQSKVQVHAAAAGLGCRPTSRVQLGSTVPQTVGRHDVSVRRLMPSSHRRRGQDKTVLSCPRLRCEMSSRQSQTVFSCPEYI